jgi:alpha-L-fucosidase
VRQFSPKTIIFSDIGPDIRWVGNESGFAGNPNWYFLNTEGFKRGEGAPPTDTLNHGNYNGRYWIPAECDVSIRPGWFWRSEEDSKVKTPEKLFEIYMASVGRGANLLLNVPPDRRGLIADRDSASMVDFKRIRDQSFGDNLLKNANTFYQFSRKDLRGNDLTVKQLDPKGEAFSVNLQNFIVELPQATKMNCIILREAIHNGQTVRKFRIVMNNGKKVAREIFGTSVGRKRILTFKTTNVTSFTVYLDDAKGTDNIIGVTAHLIDEALVEK